ncbi:MAG: TerB family tellurite resistance protein [Pseudomonadota bacterium]
MFDKLFKKMRTNSDAQTQADDTDPMQLALAALCVEAARADEDYEAREITIIDKFLAKRFSLNDDQATTLRAKAENAQADALDIQRFTRVAKDMSQEEKISFVEHLWQIVLSDGDRDPFEDTLIRRICGLIYVDDPDSGAARARVEARLTD